MTGPRLELEADPDQPGTVRACCRQCTWRAGGIEHITVPELEELERHHFNPALVHPSHHTPPPATFVRPPAAVMLPAGLIDALEAGEVVPINQETAAMILESTETVTVTITHPDPITASEVAHAMCTLVHQIAATPGGMPPDTTIIAENQHYPRTTMLPDLRNHP